MKQKSTTNWLQSSIIKIAYVHFIFVLLLAAQNIAFHAGNLLQPEFILKRWIATAVLTAVSMVVWYIAHFTIHSLTVSKALVFVLIFTDIAVVCLDVYVTRGMASLAVALFALPIATSAILHSRSALIMTAALCAAAYITTTITYFTDFFNEGLKIQLYGETLFYSATFFLQALLIWTALRAKNRSPDI